MTMTIQNYLNEGEEPIQTVSAYAGESGVSKGTLACTDRRVIFVDGDDLIDIGNERVDAIEAEGAKANTALLLLSIVFLLGGFALLIMSGIIQGSSGLFILAAVVLLIGLIMVLIAVLFRRRTLEIHTGSGSFKFLSTDASIQKFPLVIRGD